MSNVEHLIENALVAMRERPGDTYQAFKNEMSALYNQQMLQAVSITEDELWAIAQYLVYTWLPAADASPAVRCEECKHWNTVHEHIEHMECDVFCGAYGRGYPTNADDFCSYGERRADNEA